MTGPRPYPELGSVPSAEPGLTLFARRWSPLAPARALVVVVHGYAEHSGRQGAVCQRLCEAGFMVLAFDHRGFGRSAGRPGYVRSIDTCVDDLAAVVSHERASTPTLPLFIFGHSMGGAVAALFALRHPALLDGLILSSPMLRTFESTTLQRFAGVLGAVLPTLPTVPLDRSLLSRDPSVALAANADPDGYHGRVLARTGAELVKAMNRLNKDGHRLDLPLLIVHGTADRLTDPSASGDLYARAVSSDKQLGLFEGFYHETYHEPEGWEVLDMMVDWLEEHLASGEA